MFWQLKIDKCVCSRQLDIHMYAYGVINIIYFFSLICSVCRHRCQIHVFPRYRIMCSNAKQGTTSNQNPSECLLSHCIEQLEFIIDNTTPSRLGDISEQNRPNPSILHTEQLPQANQSPPAGVTARNTSCQRHTGVALRQHSRTDPCCKSLSFQLTARLSSA